MKSDIDTRAARAANKWTKRCLALVAWLLVPVWAVAATSQRASCAFDWPQTGLSMTIQTDSATIDSVMPLAVTDTLMAKVDVDTIQLRQTEKEMKAQKPVRFVPDPKRALWLSLVLPGAGQIYNRKYWKLPIIYGGFLGCTYAFMWNSQMYRDYSQAYLDIMDDDPNTKSYLDMLPPRYDITGREEQFKSLFKRKKDYYRRYRDLSAFCFVGVYLLSVIDAYVDAQLSEFDITPDLTMRLAPAVINPPQGTLSTRGQGAYGVGCSLNF